VQSAAGKVSRSRTALKRCTNTEAHWNNIINIKWQDNDFWIAHKFVLVSVVLINEDDDDDDDDDDADKSDNNLWVLVRRELSVDDICSELLGDSRVLVVAALALRGGVGDVAT